MMWILIDSQFISVGRTTGQITISPINRDALQQEVFPFTVLTQNKISKFAIKLNHKLNYRR